MTGDPVSNALESIEVTGVVSGSSAVRGLWRMHSLIDDDLKFIALVHGDATLSTDGEAEGAALTLAAGDVAILNGRSWLTLEGGSGPGPRKAVEPPAAGAVLAFADMAAADTVVLVGGRIDLNSMGRELLLRALPPVVHVSATNAVGAQVRGHVQRLFSEIVAQRVGVDFAVRQYGQLLVLDLVRGFLQDPNLPPGWLKLLGDDRLRPALQLMHDEPARRWSLADLARACTMSRTAFAQRFRIVAGTPPLGYLTNWRMLIAQRALNGGETRVGALAFELGYSSESAFSSAFKKNVGLSPAHYRAHYRAHLRENR
jgi:AraC-like DNA-binding protein